MKKKRALTPSSTVKSAGSGLKPPSYRKQLRKTAMLARIVLLEEKVSGLYRKLIEGELPNSITVRNLVLSQQGLMGELDGIKRFIADGIKRMEKETQDASLTVLRIDNKLRDINGSMSGAEDKLAEIRTTLVNQSKVQKHGNKGKTKTADPD